MLAVLGWNDGTEQEIYDLPELTQRFSIDRVHKGGAKFNYEKAKWFNHEWIKRSPVSLYQSAVRGLLEQNNIQVGDETNLEKILTLVRDRCTLLPDFVAQSAFFFQAPQNLDLTAIQPKWDDRKNQFFIELIRAYELMGGWEHDDLEKEFKEIAAASQLKTGELLLPLRIMLVGGKFGPGVFDIAVQIGKEATISRIKHVLGLLSA
jgi:glutamyl-tRNA synthetase